MTQIDTSFNTDMVNHIIDYTRVLSNIIDRYTTVINYYSYLFMGLLPFYLYVDPYFVVRNITHIYITLACSFYLYNKSVVLFAGVPSTFILDSIIRLPHDSIVYIMVFIVIATVAELTYAFVNMLKYIMTHPQWCNFIDTLLDSIETVQVDEQPDEQTEEQSDEQIEQESDEQNEEPENPEEPENHEEPENTEEQVEPENPEEPTEPENQKEPEEPTQSEQPINQSEITPVDDDLSDLPELI